MKVNSKQELQDFLQGFKTEKEYIIVKPNWVSNEYGEFTEPEILDWLLEIFPDKKKIVVESYTPWRGMKYLKKHKNDDLVVTLDGGKKYWDFYKQQDENFLEETGIGEILMKNNSEYLNITNEFWLGKCVNNKIIEKGLELNLDKIFFKELTSYIPQKLFDIKDKSLFVSLAKIKEERSIESISISMSVKNIFGLIPHPSRYKPFHEGNHENVYKAIKDMYYIYTSLFKDSLWINEGIKTMVKNYCEEDQQIIKDLGLIFIGNNGIETDKQTCLEIGINPENVKQLN